uniref:Toxin HigB-2 n=1 Tax=Arsenophonus endosymbiont of Trialeurodes vaporariorum TaxID=235567 RepID=A0A3B0MPE3_9GAMM
MFELIFHPEAAEEIYALDPVMQAKVFVAFDKLKKHGNKLRYPDTEIIQQGLFELRAGKKILLVLFLLMPQVTIYILRTFIKKTAKTPSAEIQIALKRIKDMTDEN